MPTAEPPEETPNPRLGDDIEDHCTRCKGISIHTVSAVLDGEVVRVMCRSCLSEHKFRHSKGGRDKSKERQKLIDEVMKSSPYRKE
jgi:hypothetical protein